ncbi:MAG: hypothetical protein KF776_15205 [Burkholderiales bacterium]|nr:hypothetical protein [Burkholderiales bacterium]
MTFQTFDDGPQKRPNLNRVLHGTLVQHHAVLVDLNTHGAGIFVMVNRGDGIVHSGRKTCRTKENVIAVRSLFVDLDGAPLQPLLDCPVPPDVVVESSPGRFHGYWIGAECPLEAFTPSQVALARRFGGDESASDLPRVMRLPGFLHQKGDPFMTKIIKS